MSPTTSSARFGTSACRASATCWRPSRPPSSSASGPRTSSLTVATDGAALYGSERAKTTARLRPDGFDDVAAAAVFAEHLAGISDDHLLECATEDRNRIFNLGYFTWVEQQGVALVDFEARRSQSFWTDLLALVPKWDAMIDEFNDRTGVLSSW